MDKKTRQAAVEEQRRSDDEHLLALIAENSKFCACRTRNAVFMKALGWTLNRLKASLSRLKKTQKILAIEEPPLLGQTWYTPRTLYLVSTASDAEGCLLAANLLRRRARDQTKLSVEQACGQLLCTPAQWARWIALAQQDGYCEVVQSGNPAVYRNLVRPERRMLPSAPPWTPPPPVPPVAKHALLDLLQRTDLTVTDDELSKRLGITRTQACRVRNQAVAEGAIKSCKDGRKWFLSIRHSAPHRVQKVLARLQSGPMLTNAIRSVLNLSNKAPLPSTLLKKCGVTFTNFGRDRWASLGPLPADLVQQFAERRRRNKADRDANRYQRKKLGLTAEEQAVVNEAVRIMPEVFESVCRAETPSETSRATMEFCAELSPLAYVEALRRHQPAGPTIAATDLALSVIEHLAPEWFRTTRPTGHDWDWIRSIPEAEWRQLVATFSPSAWTPSTRAASVC